METGSLGCFAWLTHLVFWGLLLRGRDELGPKWMWALVAVWLVGWRACTLLPGGPSLFMSLVALIDIVLVLVVLGGDIRIT